MTTKSKYDRSADIIVIGYGMAGAVAAIAARDAGASVVILEKQAQDAHRSCSSISGGVFLRPSNVSGAIEYMTALNRTDVPETSWTDPAIIKVWAEYSVQNKDWMEGLGTQVELMARAAEHPGLPGAETMEVWRFPGRGLRLMQFMYGQVERRGVEVLYQTAAERLLTDRKGRVIGVQAVDASGKTINLGATKGVILCCGGFEANEEMKLQYLRVYPTYFAGGQANTGDGIRMAQAVGADLWHMNCVSARLTAKFPDVPLSFMVDQDGRGRFTHYGGPKEKAAAGSIIVDRYGRRYMNENMRMHAAFYEVTNYDTHKLEFPRVPSYFIFDQRRFALGPLAGVGSGPAGPHQLYHWSLDNSDELKKGWIVKADSISALAKAIGVSPDLFQASVSGWNKCCQKGKDVEFGRFDLDLVPMDAPPFYAIKLFPGGLNTQGGPRRNPRAQVVNPFGEPIPGLYAAGECGSVYGMLYPMSGGNLGECIAFGRIAAENAMRD